MQLYNRTERITLTARIEPQILTSRKPGEMEVSYCLDFSDVCFQDLLLEHYYTKADSNIRVDDWIREGRGESELESSFFRLNRK